MPRGRRSNSSVQYCAESLWTADVFAEKEQKRRSTMSSQLPADSLSHSMAQVLVTSSFKTYFFSGPQQMQNFAITRRRHLHVSSNFQRPKFDAQLSHRETYYEYFTINILLRQIFEYLFQRYGRCSTVYASLPGNCETLFRVSFSAGLSQLDSLSYLP